MTRSTFSRVCGFTVVTLLMTRETVLIETFACAATSRIVAVLMDRSKSARGGNRKGALGVAIRVRESEAVGIRAVRSGIAAIHDRAIRIFRPRERQLAAEIEVAGGLEQYVGDTRALGARQPCDHE